MTQPIQNNDIAKSFEKLVDITYVKIDGALIQRGPNPSTGQEGFIYQDEWYKDVDGVRDAMKGIYNLISLSIINPNGDTTKLSKRYTDCYHKGESGWQKYNNDSSPE